MMASNALVFILLMVLGCAGFLFGVIYLVFHALGWFGRGVAGLVRQGSDQPADGPQRIVAGCEACGRSEERPGAHYCSQCGAGLRPIPCMDQHDQ